MVDDTIVAIATPFGAGSIAIVRLSGKNSYNIALNLTKKSSLTPRYSHLSKLYNSSLELIDEAIVIYFKAPHSFTAEDVVEFQCHGGFIVANMIVNECLKNGARMANSGEFTKRAFLNGRIDLTKAEAIAKLIESKNEFGAKILARQLNGELKSEIEKFREQLIEILAYIEVTIDYAEDDLPLSVHEDIVKKLQSLVERFNKIVAISSKKDGIFDGFKVCIVGKPNVGKSSLLNKLLNYDRAIVSNYAGTTRDTIEENLKIGTHLVKIVDTAGIRQTDEHVEKVGIERTLNAIKEADIIVAMFDYSSKLDNEDTEILNIISDFQTNKDVIFVLNKSDLPKMIDIDENLECLSVSCKQDISNLIDKLNSTLSKYEHSEDIILISNRQIEIVKSVSMTIESSLELLENGEFELFSYHINESIQLISSISKPYNYDEMLDKMFSSFCLGK
ncbi:MAG: tRNA uridine-5-carboxymethylaminomethyl(34) synthesis GTPase MnmE [Campylobacterales bacterium]|nr:tRNA uridine-5-carboxymethylaminomethyl(34) synthesis GTPase MnmE [Campylobacterales bacterium]